MSASGRSEVLSAPRIAWPTIAVAACALGAWVGTIALSAPPLLAVAINTIAAYVVFTPLHEAAHRSIARARWVNEIIGRLTSVPLMGPFIAVRYIHLQHHKHTNDPALDPDHWSGLGPRWLLPLRWLTQDLHYYFVYAQTPRPRGERLESALTLAGFFALVIVLVVLGHGAAMLVYWLIPARLALGVLAFAFDYLPHRPHRVTARQDRYGATHASPGRLKAAITLGQSLHLVHHLFPGVPFYRYGRVYRAGLTSPPGVRRHGDLSP